MKKIAALGLAGLMGLSALAMTASTASAGPLPPPGPPPPPWIHHHPGGWGGGGWGGGGWGGGGWGWGGPFILGLGLGTMYGNSYDDGYGYRGGDDHVRWCLDHYRTYSPRTDTFFIRAGVPARCMAPFDRY